MRVMESLKEELEGSEKVMASGSSSLPAASLPDIAENIQPSPHIHYQRLLLDMSHQLLCSQVVLASYHFHQKWVFPVLPLASDSGEPVHLGFFHGIHLQRFSASCTTAKTVLDQAPGFLGSCCPGNRALREPRARRVNPFSAAAEGGCAGKPAAPGRLLLKACGGAPAFGSSLWSPLDSLQQLHVLPVLRTPELNAALQEGEGQEEHGEKCPTRLQCPAVAVGYLLNFYSRKGQGFHGRRMSKASKMTRGGCILEETTELIGYSS
ncbi:uncharacterized protein LOC128853643 [Cuculus canorus]|uniref:uncharacterized protein LOC128853643 n=1 Tax=Cuculus canorus TaxID=55661 RepID=UPI0023AAFCF0|nr:uncharacterized protein LOC128853643 [Cuculus canorus]